MKIAYSHLVSRIKDKPSVSELSKYLFQLGHEHEIENGIFNMEFTPNRGDCLSLNGLLRDLSVFYTTSLNNEIYGAEIDKLDFNFENLSKNICPKISFLEIEVDNIPREYSGVLKNYFSDLNLNSTNFFTDISNYISYETGQPTHCYDANSLSDRLFFKEIDHEVEFETLLESKINLTKKNSVFIQNDKVINLAGVIGGKKTSCSSATKTVLIECAYFKPEAIIGKSVKYDIQSEASHKFERGVDPECHEAVLRRFIKIVSDHSSIKNIAIFTEGKKENMAKKILMDVGKINKILGIEIREEECIGYLSKLGFDTDGDFIKIPSYRHDVSSLNDLAEEIGRVIGYDNIERKEIAIPVSNKKDNESIENKLRYFLLDHGFYEVINNPFVSRTSKDAIMVDNPLDSNRKHLRTNILDSLIENLLFNERRQKDSIKLFEISDIYTINNNKVNKKRKLSLIASGRIGLNYEDFSKKINKNYLKLLFSKISEKQVFDFKTISREGLDTKINSEIVGLEIDIDEFSRDILSYNETAKSPKDFKQYVPINDLPSSTKDISYSVKNPNNLDKLQELLLNYQSDIIKKIFIFDYFYNEKYQEIKVGFRFIFQSKEKTLTSSEIDIVYNKILSDSLDIDGIEIPGLHK